MKQSVTVTQTGVPGGPRVRLDRCPSCTRPVLLDFVGLVEEDGEYVDLAAVATAQRLHLNVCTG